jgi:hypothetical protein
LGATFLDLKTQLRQLCATPGPGVAGIGALPGWRCFNQSSRLDCVTLLEVMKLPSVFRKPVRVTITLPHNIYQHLKKRSDEEGRSLSNLAAFLIEKSLD